AVLLAESRAFPRLRDPASAADARRVARPGPADRAVRPRELRSASPEVVRGPPCRRPRAHGAARHPPSVFEPHLPRAPLGLGLAAGRRRCARPDVEVTRVHRTAAGWPEEGADPPPGRFRRRQGPTGEDGRRVAASLITRAKDPTHALHHP